MMFSSRCIPVVSAKSISRIKSDSRILRPNDCPVPRSVETTIPRIGAADSIHPVDNVTTFIAARNNGRSNSP